MINALRKLRRTILTPKVSATRFDVRGFHEKNPEARELLEKIGTIFLTGYGYAAEAPTADAIESPLAAIPARFRGFAYEGAGMGFAIRDGLPFPSRRHVVRLLAGHGRRHTYIVYCGIGWAMARLPKFCWPRAQVIDPLLRWLVLDGYGFHQAYFHTKRYVHEQYQDPKFRWPADGPAWYASRAIDQGVGRALWFVGGADPHQVTTLIRRFATERRGDLYAGAGLAATFAGGVDEAELREFAEQAGSYRPQLAQGSAFAAEARVRADIMAPHTDLATGIFCGMTAERAAAVTIEARTDLPVGGDVPQYEIWRQRLANRFSDGNRTSTPANRVTSGM